MTTLQQLREARRAATSDREPQTNRQQAVAPCRHRSPRITAPALALHDCAELGRLCHPGPIASAEAFRELDRRGIASCEACPLRQPPEPLADILVGVTAAPRRRPVLGRCLETLAAAGWPPPFVFCDGAVEKIPAPQLCRATIRRSDNAGALASFAAAAAELVARGPDCWHLLVQDDTAHARDSLAHLRRLGIPEDAAVCKLFTVAECEGPAPGWHEIPPEYEMRGAQCYLFPPRRLEELLASPWILRQRRGELRANEAIDNVVARWARHARGRQYAITPSLVEHTGRDCSTLGHSFPTALSYCGDHASALELPGRPLVSCVMVTRGDRDCVYGSIEAFRRQTYEPRELVILNDGRPLPADRIEPARQILIDDEPRKTLGELRNLGIGLADGPIVCQWDDDDHSAPTRIAEQMAAWRPGAIVTLRRQLRADLDGGDALVFDRPAGIEGTVLHDRDTPHRYPAKGKEEDTEFLRRWRDRVVLDNRPELYTRFYHGQNTWDRAHILEPAGPAAATRAATVRENLLVEQIRARWPAAPRRRWLQILPSIEGWSDSRFCRLLAELASWQARGPLAGRLAADGARGLAEIGVHHGRTLLGLAAAATEDPAAEVWAIDSWEDGRWHDSGPDSPLADDATRWAMFHYHLRRLFPATPDQLRIHRGRSADVDREQLPPLRLLHIDGSHEYADVLADLELARATLHPAGLLAIDDVCNHRWPAVGAAFWTHQATAARAAGRAPWRPLALVGGRLLCARSGEPHAAELYTGLCRRSLRSAGALKTAATPAGEILTLL